MRQSVLGAVWTATPALPPGKAPSTAVNVTVGGEPVVPPLDPGDPEAPVTQPFSHQKHSVFSRIFRPNGPIIHVRYPSVKAVQLSALRHTSKPVVPDGVTVSCKPSPLSMLW